MTEWLNWTEPLPCGIPELSKFSNHLRHKKSPLLNRLVFGVEWKCHLRPDNMLFIHTKYFLTFKSVWFYLLWDHQIVLGLFRQVQFSRSVVSNSLWPYESQHTRPPCPSPAPGVYPNSSPLSRWCHPTISSSVVPFLLPPSIFPSIRVFSNESVLRIRLPKYWSFSFNISSSNEHPELISFRMDWLDLLAVQGTLKSLLQHHSSKASILCLAFFIYLWFFFFSCCQVIWHNHYIFKKYTQIKDLQTVWKRAWVSI